MARYELPGGAVLDRIETESLPADAPCWEPGTSARVLFVALDGQLYWLDLEGSDPPGSSHQGGERRPRRLSWADSRPGLGQPFICDLAWPAEPRMGRRLLAALRVLERGEGSLRHSSWQLWWLQLGQDRSTIVAAGPLLRPDPAIPALAAWADRSPTLLVGPDGELFLAYLAFRPGIHLGQLRIAPLRIDAATGDPWAEAGRPVLAGDCLPTALVPSADGRWICCVEQSEGSRPKLRRVDLAEVRRRSPHGDDLGRSGGVSRPPTPPDPSSASTSDR